VKRPDSALVALTVGAAGSAAANVVWTWGDPVRVVAGLFTTALVPVSLHFWPRVPVHGWGSRGLRAAIMSLVCAAAAGVNLVHAVMLLVSRGESLWLAVPTVAAIELVVVMASLARRRPGVPVSRPAAVPPVPAVPAVSREAVPAGRAEGSPVPAVGGVSRDAATATGQVDGQGARGVPVLSHPGTAAAASPVPVSHPVPGVSAQVAEVSHPAAAPVSQSGGNDEDGVSRGVPADRPADTDGVPGVPDLSPAERDAYRWAVQAQQDGRDVGFRQLQEEFPKLSKRDALKVAKAARGQAGTGLHAVG